MKKSDKKTYQKQLVQDNISQLLLLSKNPTLTDFHKDYINQVLELAKSSNVRLTREQKLQFCKKCLNPWNSKTCTIRLNSRLGAKEYSCLECGYVRRFSYKK
jgi:RNase P subunit RPR2